MTRVIPPQGQDNLGNQVPISFSERDAPQQEQDRSLGRLIYECGLLLRLGGLGLIGVYLVSVITQLIPLQLLKPQWQLDVITSLCGAGNFALEGALFILVAERLDVISSVNFQWSSRIRHLALPAGLGFLLLIPLHMSATQRLIGQQKLQDQKLLIHLQDTKQQIADAQSPAALQNAIIPLQLNPTPMIPSNPATFQLIRNSLLRDIQPQLTRIQDTIQEKKVLPQRPIKFLSKIPWWPFSTQRSSSRSPQRPAVVAWCSKMWSQLVQPTESIDTKTNRM